MFARESLRATSASLANHEVILRATESEGKWLHFGMLSAEGHWASRWAKRNHGIMLARDSPGVPGVKAVID